MASNPPWSIIYLSFLIQDLFQTSLMVASLILFILDLIGPLQSAFRPPKCPH